MIIHIFAPLFLRPGRREDLGPHVRPCEYIGNVVSIVVIVIVITRMMTMMMMMISVMYSIAYVIVITITITIIIIIIIRLIIIVIVVIGPVSERSSIRWGDLLFKWGMRI